MLGLGVDRAGEAEVGDLDPAGPGVRIRGEQDVLRLHVAVDHPGAVRRGERGEHRLEHAERLAGLHRRLLADQVAQREAGDELHDEEQGAVVVALVEDRDDVGVGEASRVSRLSLEPRDEVGVVAEPGVHHLDRDGAVQPQVGGLVDRGHPAAGDAGADAVAAVEDAADQRVALTTLLGALHAVVKIGSSKLDRKGKVPIWRPSLVARPPESPQRGALSTRSRTMPVRAGSMESVAEHDSGDTSTRDAGPRRSSSRSGWTGRRPGPLSGCR